MSTKLAIYFIGFSVTLLVILWLCETVFLEQIYKTYKTASVKQQADNISQYIGNENLNNDIDSFKRKYESTIIVADNRGNIIAKTASSISSFIVTLSKEQIREKFDLTIEKGGANVEFPDNNLLNIEIETDEKTFANSKTRNIVYYKSVDVNNVQYIIMVESELAPIAATVEALRFELIIITIIILILTVLMVTFISRKLANPIIKTNEAAKKLAKGEFPDDFNNSGYREIAELNETLEYASVELARVDKLSNEIIANVSHDLRTPLTMISGYAEAMRDIPGESSPENLQIIIDESDRLKNLVNQLLFLSKLKSGSNKLQKSTFNITEVTRSIVTRINRMVEPDGFEVIFANIEIVNVYADEERIEQVIYNLIANAIAYTGEDAKVLVRQTVLENGVRIEVIDSGKGIEAEMIPYVWKRYYKNPYAKSAYKGVGVGLSIVKGILDLHEAEYGIYSEVGKGSNFWFILKNQ